MATDVEPPLTLIYCSYEDWKESGCTGKELHIPVYPASGSASQFLDLLYRYEPIARLIVRIDDDCPRGMLVAP